MKRAECVNLVRNDYPHIAVTGRHRYFERYARGHAMTEPILVERADGEDEGIVTVVLNRPEKLNAMTRAMWGRLGEAMTELSTDETVRCLIVRGAGERAFSPGNDISAFETDRSNAEQAEAYGALMHQTIDEIGRAHV